MFKVKVLIKRRPSILDPQGKAVEKGAAHLGLTNIKDTRIGKFIEFTVDSNDKNAAENEITVVQKAQEAHNAECTKYPDYLKVLLGKEEWNNSCKVNK